MEKNIFVLGLDQFNLQYLRRSARASGCAFHALLSYDEIRGSWEYPVQDLLVRCRRRLDAFRGSIDAIIGYWDFPVTDMVPILCKAYGLPGASLESVLKCEHKYWSRVEQSRVIPEAVPLFEGFDPFDEDRIQKISLLYPFWIKPSRSYRSYLAFKVNDQKGLSDSLEQIRANVGRIADPFRILLDETRIQPEMKQKLVRNICVAESLLSGRQCTVEGYVYNKWVYCCGIVDSVREADRSSLLSYIYPSTLPDRVQSRMRDLSRKIMEHIDYDQATFNIEFFYNQTDDSITLLEINPRCSQSHAYLFEKVDGTSNLSAMVDLALGQEPDHPSEKGQYRCAAKYMLRSYNDGIVSRVPSRTEKDRVQSLVPDAEIKVLVKKNMRLRELDTQDSYSYELMDLFIAGVDEEDLAGKYRRCLDHLAIGLKLRFSPATCRPQNGK